MNNIKMTHRKGIYEVFLKRILDFILSLCGLIVLFPLLFILTILGTIFMRGNPFFIQQRPGKDEKIFKLIKFRTMDNRRDENGELLQDEERLNRYGRLLRCTSLDELPELINILKGDMSIVGPRPQLVRDMVFMSDEVRKRHSVKPGLTGLAQVNGRNTITWEKKFEYDLIYIKEITFINDVKIILATVAELFRIENFKQDGVVVDVDYGDWLLINNKIDEELYIKYRTNALEILQSN